MTNIKQRDELQAAIWKIANEVRGAVDGWDFKQFVLGTLFYRFISENFTNFIEAGDESVDYAHLSDDVITPEIKDDATKTKGYFIYPSQLFVNIAEGANSNPNLNTDLATIFNAIESSANGYASEHDIKGLFADFDTTSNRLGNTVEEKNKRLAAVIKGVESLDFGNFEDSEIDLFGDAYEFLISNYAANAGKSGGEFFTPQNVSKLIAQLALFGQSSVNKIYDPACGSGSLLLQAKKQFDEETGLYYYGARYLNPVASIWYGVDPLAEKYVSISPYSYCKSSPMNYIDEKGLYPKGIVTIHYERSIVTTAPSITGATMNVPTQYVYYKFTKSATHLLSLVSGVPENYIKNVRLEEFNLQRESNSITLGDSPENTRMLVSPEYFNEENISKEQYYDWWFKEFSHEVGHIKQIKRDGSEGLYLLKTLWGYVSTLSHDKAPREREAEKGSEVFESFRDFVKSKFHANLNRLFIGKGSEEEKIKQIDKWWNAYKEQEK